MQSKHVVLILVVAAIVGYFVYRRMGAMPVAVAPTGSSV